MINVEFGLYSLHAKYTDNKVDVIYYYTSGLYILHTMIWTGYFKEVDQLLLPKFLVEFTLIKNL